MIRSIMACDILKIIIFSVLLINFCLLNPRRKNNLVFLLFGYEKFYETCMVLSQITRSKFCRTQEQLETKIFKKIISDILYLLT